jgi:predicted flap endonuclease-1-like 5' DNA nuclease
MNLWIAFFLGIAVGWLIEWLIDFFYSRNKIRLMQAELNKLRSENASAAAQLEIEEEAEIQPDAAVEGEPSVETTLEEEWLPVEAEETRAAETLLIGELAEDTLEQPVEESEEALSVSSGEADLAGVVAGATLVSALDQADQEEEAPAAEEIEAPLWVLEEEDSQSPKGMVAEVDQAAALPGESSTESVSEETTAEVPDPFSSASMRYDIEYIEGIGPIFGEKLRQAGITTVGMLLQAGAAPKGRAQIVANTGIRHDLILRWVNQADLKRVKGIGSEYSELLEKAGVDTVMELSRRNPENLFDKLAATNAEKKLVRQIPTLKDVQDWVEQAKSLPRVVNY